MSITELKSNRDVLGMYCKEKKNFYIKKNVYNLTLYVSYLKRLKNKYIIYKNNF